MPKEWAKTVAQSTWRPPGSKEELPALRVSMDDNWSFAPEGASAGLFVGLMRGDDDPAKAFPDPKQYGCQSTDVIKDRQIDGRRVLDQYSFDCGDGSTLLQRVVVTGNTGDSLFMQVKVPASEESKALEMANSVQYN
jgi:hypothetical protein